MTFKQAITHLIFWLREFPLFHNDPHLRIGHTGHPEWECWICGAKGVDDA
jgi:hypothetical protein